MKEYILTKEHTELIESNLHLVRWVIKRYIRPNEAVMGLEYDDLYQEGSLALCRAAATYDKASAQFNTYAITVIRNHLYDYCRSICAEQKNTPTVSMEAYEAEGMSIPAHDAHAGILSDAACEALLARFKQKYRGAARLGIEAMELQVRGYTGKDIAGLFGVKPNYIGACISRAAQKLRKEDEISKFFFGHVEKPISTP